MLETQSRFCGRCTYQTASADGSLAHVAILDRISGAQLGSVHRCSKRRLWSRWFAPSAWDVFETDDLSHVFSLRRSWPWSPEWAVHDSEGHWVGTVLTPPVRFIDLRLFLSDVRRRSFERIGETRIEDGQGLCVARLQEKGDTGQFLSIAGAELGCFSRSGDDCELTFGEALADSPFTRMLLLAAALVSM